MFVLPFFPETSSKTITIDGVTYRVPLIDSSGHLQVDVLSSALPSGAATAAKQDTMITALQLIDDLRGALLTVSTDYLRVVLNLPGMASPNLIYNGVVTVANAGTRVQFTDQSCIGVSIKADKGNTGNLYLGNSSVEAANGRVLEAGEVASLAVDNLDRLYVDSASDGDKLSYLAVG